MHWRQGGDIVSLLVPGDVCAVRSIPRAVSHSQGGSVNTFVHSLITSDLPAKRYS